MIETEMSIGKSQGSLLSKEWQNSIFKQDVYKPKICRLKLFKLVTLIALYQL